MKLRLLLLCLLSAFFPPAHAQSQEKLIIVNEGNWQHDNGRLSYFENGRIVSNEWFRKVNGYKIGDTPNDIIQINDNLIAIAINWSNIVQFITPEGKAVAATEDVPNNRKLCSDGKYLYISSYGHECGTVNGLVTFEKGFVAKIDLNTFKVVKTIEVGWEPEGIALYKGHLFVANTGGYAFQEPHEYEHTVSVINAETMKLVREVDTNTINLYGKMSQSGKYLCINSPGDYYDVMPASLIFNCEAALAGKPDKDCYVKLDYASTYNCVNREGEFFIIGSKFSYYTNEYEFNYATIEPDLAFRTGGSAGIRDELPGTMLQDIKAMQQPYGIYVNPYTGYMYATDACEFVSAASLVQWDPKGKKVGTYKIYINPAHFLALPPDGHFGAITDIIADPRPTDDAIYNLQGIRVTHPVEGRIYIRKGKKFIYRNN